MQVPSQETVMPHTGHGLTITFSPRWWSFISSTRIFVESFCGHSFGHPHFSGKVAIAAHELLENAVKYSLHPDSPVTCAVSVEDGSVRLRVENVADAAHVQVLRDEIESLMRGDPMDVYVERMHRSLSSDKSQLGLARVRCETGADLRLVVSGNKVTIDALFSAPDHRG